jgi:DNA-binding NarL/FixJ family response regulator
MKCTRIILADDHAIVLEGIRKLLETEFDVVGVANNGRALLSLAPKVHPDVAIVDISMPLLNGIEATRRLKKTLPECQIIILTMHADLTYVREAFRAGASGFLTKRCMTSDLARAIREVVRGRYYVAPEIEEELLRSEVGRIERTRLIGTASSHDLTARQREVIQLIAEGCSQKEIAGILHISTKTVEFHRSCIARKLGVHSIAELTRYALEHGLAGS